MKYLLILITFILLSAPASGGPKELTAEAVTPGAEKMVREQIIKRGIQDPLVLKAMLQVPRHRLVPGYLKNAAYLDRPLPIGYGQTISQPYIVAYMLEITGPQPHHRALEIGTGSGYQAAVLAEIVEEVYTIEIVRELGERARKDLAELGYENIKVKLADGYWGWEEHAPYDSIIVTAAAEYIPPPLINQLAEGGRMIIPVGHPYRAQYLILIEKEDGEITTERLIPVRFVPFTREEEETD